MIKLVYGLRTRSPTSEPGGVRRVEAALTTADTAPSGEVERDQFKRRVRSLKEPGLTTSLPVGYRLSPRGPAYLAAVDAAIDTGRASRG